MFGCSQHHMMIMTVKWNILRAFTRLSTTSSVTSLPQTSSTPHRRLHMTAKCPHLPHNLYRDRPRCRYAQQPDQRAVTFLTPREGRTRRPVTGTRCRPSIKGTTIDEPPHSLRRNQPYRFSTQRGPRRRRASAWAPRESCQGMSERRVRRWRLVRSSHVCPSTTTSIKPRP